MDETVFLQKMAEELVGGWDIIRTGDGFLIVTDWHWPNRERIEIFVRTVGEREDLYLVTDGGSLFNLFFDREMDLTKDEQSMKAVHGIAASHDAKVVDFQLARGANDENLAQAVRTVLEAVKEASFLLWHKTKKAASIH